MIGAFKNQKFQRWGKLSKTFKYLKQDTWFLLGKARTYKMNEPLSVISGDHLFIKGVRNVSFAGNFSYLLNEWFRFRLPQLAKIFSKQYFLRLWIAKKSWLQAVFIEAATRGVKKRPATLLKWDPNTVFFLWNLRNF